MRIDPRALVACLLVALAACAPAAAPRTPGVRFSAVQEIVAASKDEVRPRKYEPPRYPAQSKKDGVEAAFGSYFVLDTAGRVEPGTVAFTPEAPVEFRSAACDALRSSRWAPVIREGRARRALMIAGWAFALGSMPSDSQGYQDSPLYTALARDGVEATIQRLSALPGCA